MDLVADMLLQELATQPWANVDAVGLRPRMVERFSRLPVIGALDGASRVDRITNRFWDYPRWLGRRRHRFDVFHVVDHSYAHLVHVLPADRTVVTCHDIDAFRSLVSCGSSRSRLPKTFSRRTLTGLQQAAVITCVSEATRADLIEQGLVAEDKLVVVQNGVHPSYSAEPNSDADAQATVLLGAEAPGTIDLLHVGSTIPRKRVDVLLRVVAAVRNCDARARLIRIGGPFTHEQEKLARDLGIDTSVVALPFLDRRVLAAVYRRATLLLQPSDAEGFGLPVLEALACGTPVVASDLPVLREVAERSAVFCPVGDIAGWRDAIVGLLREREHPDLWAARRAACVRQTSRFTWREYARAMTVIYRDVLERAAGSSAAQRHAG